MFFANLVEGLALFLSLAALATAARAIHLTRRHRPTSAAPTADRQADDAITRARRANANPIPKADRDSQPTGSNTDGSAQPRGNALRDQIRAFLAENAESDFSLVQLSKAVDRRSATVSYAVGKLIEAGDVQLTRTKPNRYGITPDGLQVHQQHPATPAQPTLVETSPSAPAPATDEPVTAETSVPAAATQPPAAGVAPVTGDAQPNSNTNGNGRGNALRDQIRAFLAEHPEQDFSLVQLSKAVDRRSATVSYAVGKLVDAGEAQLTSPKPRRYAIAPAGAQTTDQQQPTPEPAPEPVTEPAAEPTPEPPAASVAPPVTSTEQTKQTKQATEPKPAPAPAATQTRKGAAKASAEQLRDRMRGFLAQHPGADFTLLNLAEALHVDSARLGYAITKLVEGGEVKVTSTAIPRRYTLAGGTPTDPTPEPESKPAGPTPAKRRGRASSTQATATVTSLPTERSTTTSTTSSTSTTTATASKRRGGRRRR